jgi:translation elongation factor EF-4
VGGTRVHRVTVDAYKKDFSKKMHGNMRDRSRVMKQLKKQEKGKERMAEQNIGGVQIPKEAYISILTR